MLLFPSSAAWAGAAEAWRPATKAPRDVQATAAVARTPTARRPEALRRACRATFCVGPGGGPERRDADRSAEDVRNRPTARSCGALAPRCLTKATFGFLTFRYIRGPSAGDPATPMQRSGSPRSLSGHRGREGGARE